MRTSLRLILFGVFLCLIAPRQSSAQGFDEFGEYRVDWGGYLFGVKGGLSLGNQDWSNLETEFLAAYHGALFLESIPAGGRFSFYGQLGYHVRGSRISRRRGIDFSGNRYTLPADDFRFQNIALGIGAKSVVRYARLGDLYYSLGLRLEYSLGNNLDKYNVLTNTNGIAFRNNYPFNSPDLINEIVYGVSFGGGILFPLGPTKSGFIELTGHPDLSFQYEQGTIDRLIGTQGGIPARMIRNFTIELSVGIRFLRKWDYID